MNTASATALSKLRDNVGLAYRGDGRAVDLLLTALLSRGHVLIEDVPGVGKTTLARALGRSLALDFRRIQFTSDTLPADVLGISVFHAPNDRFEFHPGPIFANIVLADEINRATPKTQSALLEAMNETAVTVESERRPLPQPFMVVATQNPVEYLGTYPLPESQMDRFFLRLSLGYPAENEEKMLLRRGGTERVLASIPAVLSPAEVSRPPGRDGESGRRRPAPRLHPGNRPGHPADRGAPAARFDARSAGVLPGRAGPRAPRRTRLRHAGRRPGRRGAGSRAPDPVHLVGRIRGGREGEGDRPENPVAGAGPGVIRA